ncbi:amino acid ABC transporter permease [Alloyangia pacifica]|uniref:Polar amino acid transport system permease protein n=1 Tax=Alloyangia pacifica TaxID=311180 RepID=A0A1I6UUY5_9RHOB|nr:amino acid ABC transporter permease [Alloyangia pacifica]SDI54105.1 polar amino acid transport system permease protein [Alloyangia pacifica]SFT05206.1 polar amino acid transport system permease protein [Alloyangia pacifica]
MNYQWDFGIIWSSMPVFGRGIVVTIELTLICLVLGLILGMLLSLAQMSRVRALQVAGRSFVEFFRNIPALIQLIWFFYAFPILIGAQLSPFTAAVLGITLNTGAYCAEIYRSGIQSIARGQWEGARAIGMSDKAIFRRIILPQVFDRMLPAFTNRAVEVAKITSLASVLSVHDLMYQGRLLSATYYRPLEILTAVGILYLCIIYPLSFASMMAERHLARKR